MYLRQFIVNCTILCFAFSAPLQSANEDLLGTDDVHRVMNEILNEHVEKNNVSQDILRHGFTSYINQFDPARIYLLRGEVDQFQSFSDADMRTILGNYKSTSFKKFRELNGVIQQAILRARAIRSELLLEKEGLFHQSKGELVGSDTDEGMSFVATSNDLRQKIQNNIVNFITLERQRYGDETVFKNKDRTLNAYEQMMRNNENQYLYHDSAGRALASNEKENLFTIHLLKALARSLDSHTTFLDQNEAYDMKIRLEKGFKGIGIVLELKPEGVVISRLIKGGPAEKSGLVHEGDQIVKVNGDDVSEKPLEFVIERLRDDNVSSTALVLRKPDESVVSVILNREIIAVDDGRVDISHEKYDNGIIGKLTLHSFYQGKGGITSEKDIREAVGQLKREGNLRGLVLDLRENGGGFLNQAVKVSGLFISNGIVVISKYSNGEQRYYRDMDGKVLFDGPIVVLTSKVTASAAEIVAQALQDYGVAVVVGDEQTYGKGTIQSQTVTEGNNASHFKVTVGKYYTVSGKTPQVEGVKADIVVPSHYSHELIGEGYLENAIRADTIASAFKDELADIDPGLRPWYIRYYIPTLQRPEHTWRELIPKLKERSEKRIASNEDYQKFLGEGGKQKVYTVDKGNTVSDMQMSEALNIVKDMIQLEDQEIKAKLANF